MLTAGIVLGVRVPQRWIVPEKWRGSPGLTVSSKSVVYWLKDATTSDLVYRHEQVFRAGLNTLVFIPVPNGDFIQRAIILRDFPPREADAEEMRALTIAVFLFGRTVPWAQEATPELPGEAREVTRLDPDSRSLIGPGASVRLTVYEWDLLSVLFEREGHAVSFNELAHEVWRAPEEYVGRAVVYEVVARLRRQLSAVTSDYRISSVPRFGYVLERVNLQR